MVFATRPDLLAVLGRIERRVPLTYRLRVSNSTEVPAWGSAAAIDSLGTAVEGGSLEQPSFLVMPAASRFTLWEREQPGGRTLRGVYPEGNPDSVVFWPGGVFAGTFLVAGEFAVALPKPAGYDLVGAVQRAVRAEFERVQDCYVGPGARELAASGVRLVGSTRQPPEVDLLISAR